MFFFSVLPNHQGNSNHPRSRSSSLQESATLNDTLIKIILLLLSGLLLANSLLFYKMWRLEVDLGSSPLSNLEEVLIATARGQHENLGLGKFFWSLVKSRGVCKKFATRPKNLPLTKFHDIRVKVVDFLEIAKFWLSSKFSAYLSIFLKIPKESGNDTHYPFLHYANWFPHPSSVCKNKSKNYLFHVW